MLEEEKKEDTPGNTSPTGTSPSPERYVQQQPDRPVGGVLGMFSKLGNLPEWGIRGKKLSGKPLNYGIGLIASCGFLMFGLVAVAKSNRIQPLH